VRQTDSHLFWINEDGTLASVAKRGEGESFSLRLERVARTETCGIAVDGDTVYATAYPSAIVEVKLDGRGGHPALAPRELAYVAGPTSLATDRTNVYVTTYGGAVLACPRDAALADAGPRCIELAVVAPNTRDLVADDTRLYWADSGGVRGVPKQGGTPLLLSLGGGSSEGARDLVVANGSLSWRAGGRLWRVDLQRLGAPEEITLRREAPDPPVESSWKEQAGGLCTAGADVYCRCEDGKEGRKTCIKGVSFAPCRCGALQPDAFAVDGMNLVVAAEENILVASLAGGIATPVFRYRDPDLDRPATLLRVDATSFYWARDKTIWTRRR
jgi:hypothetical protein